MNCFCTTFDNAISRCSEKVRLKLDSREAVRAFGECANASVTAGGIGKTDNRCGVEKTVRRHNRPPHGKFGFNPSVAESGEFDAEKPWQKLFAEFLRAGCEIIVAIHFTYPTWLPYPFERAVAGTQLSHAAKTAIGGDQQFQLFWR